MLAAFLQFFLNVLLIGSMLVFVGFGVYLSISADNHQERYIRFGALFSGGLVVLGAQAGGVDFAQFIANALASTNAAGTGVSVVLSGAAGAGVGIFLIRWSHRGDIFAIRIMIFVGTLAATQFAEIYVTTVHAHGFGLGAAVVPNIAFVVGILLCIALTYDPRNPARSRHLLKSLQRSSVLRAPSQSAPTLGAAPNSVDPGQQP
jgi:hypothetical protein